MMSDDPITSEATTRRSFLQQSAGIAAGAFAGTMLTRASLFAAGPAPAKIKIGQIGTGHGHATKVEVYRNSPDYEVVGIVESDPQLRAAAEKNAAFRGLPWMTEGQLLAAPGLQAVLVETRVGGLLDTAQKCIAAGKHVHLDKPAGASFPQYQQLLQSAGERKLLVQMGYMFRYNPAVVLLRQFLAEGWLGDVFEVQATMSKVVPPADRLKLAEFSGGMMFELGSHLVDVVVTLMGKPTRVEAIGRHSSTLQDKLLDNALAILEYERAAATLRSTALEVDGGSRRHLVVCGTMGTFHIQPLDAPNVRYTLDRPRGKYEKGTHEIRMGGYPRYVGDAADMARIIRGEKETDYPAAHDLAVQETLLLASGMPLK